MSPRDLERNESLKLDPVSELKRQRSTTPAPQVKSAIPKFVRKNTDARYIDNYEKPQPVSIRPPEEGVHMILTATINGVDYQSEMCQ